MNASAAAMKEPTQGVLEPLGELLTKLQQHLHNPISATENARCRELINEAMKLAVIGSKKLQAKKIGDRLTRREYEIALELSIGKSNSTIADELFISVNTVRFHVRNILRKLEVNNRSEVAALVLRSDIH